MSKDGVTSIMNLASSCSQVACAWGATTSGGGDMCSYGHLSFATYIPLLLVTLLALVCGLSSCVTNTCPIQSLEMEVS